MLLPWTVSVAARYRPTESILLPGQLTVACLVHADCG